MSKLGLEPVAWLSKCYNDDSEFLGYTVWDRDVGEGAFPVYTNDTSEKHVHESDKYRREWVGFSHEELAWLNEALNLGGRFAVIEAIEAKLKEKNT